MSFLNEDGQLLEKCDKICDKFSNSIKKEFDSKPQESETYLRTKKHLIKAK